MHQNIAILLSTYNGDKYLEELINSIFQQSYKEFILFIRDDGSTDTTLEVIKRLAVHLPNIIVLPNPNSLNIGPVRSYHLLLEYTIQCQSKFEYIMFADQDDVWLTNKIEKTLDRMTMLSGLYPDEPILIHTDLQVVDEQLKLIDRSFFHYQLLNSRVVATNRLLVQNNITACTLMINRKLANLSLPINDEAIMHDWWIGLVASTFGKISCLTESTILYRQHRSNSVGAKQFSLNYIINRLKKPFSVDHHVTQALAFLYQYDASLNPSQKRSLTRFVSLRYVKFHQKIFYWLIGGFYKMDFIRNGGMLLALLEKNRSNKEKV